MTGPSESVAQAVAAAPAAQRLALAITRMAHEHPGRVAIVGDAGSDGHRTIDYGTLAAAIEQFERGLAAAEPVGVVARAVRPDALVVIAAACGRRGVPLAILSPDAAVLADALSDWTPLDDSLTPPSHPAPRSAEGFVPSPVIVATSGTSGPPKLVGHSWDAVLAATRLSGQWHGRGWLLAYDAARWAGIQVWAQALLTGGRLVVPASRDPDVVARALADEAVTVLPATPTLLRRLAASADRSLLARTVIERITLGGEAADPQLLELARATFPTAKLTHVYATTELGEVLRVSDGRAGFPAAWLGQPLPGGGRLSMGPDGELLVQRSPHAPPVATGDLVETRGDRCVFVGRRTDVIVVGGAKAYPQRIEELLRGVPGIVEARVHGIPSVVTGELVAAEIVLADPLPAGTTPEGVRAAALDACRTHLEPHAVPRIVDIVTQTAVTPAGKTSRTDP